MCLCSFTFNLLVKLNSGEGVGDELRKIESRVVSRRQLRDILAITSAVADRMVIALYFPELYCYPFLKIVIIMLYLRSAEFSPFQIMMRSWICGRSTSLPYLLHHHGFNLL